METEIKENVAKALSSYKKILAKYEIKEGKKITSKFKFKKLIREKEDTIIDKVIFTINIDEEGNSPMILIDCYSNCEFVGNFAFADKELVLDKYDKYAIKNKLDIPQNTRQYDIKLLNKKFIDNLKLKLGE